MASFRRFPAFARAQDGASAVEFALVAPVLIMFLLGIMEFSRLLFDQSMLTYAVQEAARCGAVNTTTCNSTSATQSYAVTMAAPFTVPSTVFTVTAPGCGTQVAASYGFTFLVPQLFPWTITLTALACHP